MTKIMAMVMFVMAVMDLHHIYEMLLSQQTIIEPVALAFV
jgi:hypothetical protein